MKSSRLGDFDLVSLTRTIAAQDITGKKEDVPTGMKMLEDYVTAYREEKDGDRGVAVYIDSDIKKAIDKIKSTIINAPARHIINGVLRAYIEEHREEIIQSIKSAEQQNTKTIL